MVDFGRSKPLPRVFRYWLGIRSFGQTRIPDLLPGIRGPIRLSRSGASFDGCRSLIAINMDIGELCRGNEVALDFAKIDGSLYEN